MSHEAKRKEMQIKELQGRLDTGDGCKYTSIDTTTDKSPSNLRRNRFFAKFMPLVVVQAAALHAVYAARKHFSLSRGLFGK